MELAEPGALIGVFLASFLSATLLFGLSEASVVAAALGSDTSRLALFIAATSGNVLGAVVNYALGRFLIRFRNRRWFPIGPKAEQRASSLFARHGQPVLLLSWLPVVGDPLTVIAGALGMNLAPFLIYVTIGKAARYAVLLWLVT